MDAVSTFFFSQGILGVLVLVLGVVVLRLYGKTEKLQKEKEELLEARRIDAKDTAQQVTSILPNLSQTLQNISDKIEISKQGKR